MPTAKTTLHPAYDPVRKCLRCGPRLDDANSAIAALYRIEQLVQEAVVTVPRLLIAEAIDLVVFIAGRGTDRRIASIARVPALDPDTGAYALVELLTPQPQGE